MNDMVKFEKFDLDFPSTIAPDAVMKAITIRESGAGLKKFELKSLDSADLAKIAEFMPEIDRATTSFGKRQSQFMDFVMTVSGHPLAPARNLRQLLAEIERRREALRETVTKIKYDIVLHEELRERLESMKENIEQHSKFEVARLIIQIEDIEGRLASTRLYYEGALKTLLSMQQAYKDIIAKHHMEDWDEEDFEKEEERYHIMKAFEQAMAAVAQTGRIDMGNQEYLRQLGINPVAATLDLLKYLQDEEHKYTANGGENSGITSLLMFLERMANKYQGNVSEILEKKGISPEGFYKEAVFDSKHALTNKEE